MAERVLRSLCGFCHANCGIRVHVRDGAISHIEGDPDHPVNRGRICPKASAIKPLTRSAERLKEPLKRTKGGFSRVSWDEALDFAADRLTAIRENHGPESLVHCNGAPVTYGARDGFLQFMGVYGSPNHTGAANLCFVPRQVAFLDAFGGRPEPDYEKTRFVIFWGSNPVNSTRLCYYAAYDGFDEIIPRLKERKVPIVVVDPVRSETVRLADEWIRPAIGTDVALGLAMANTILSEGLHDRRFAERWIPGLDEIARHVEAMTPEWAERITSVPAGAIRRLARSYAGADGAAIIDGNGLDMHTTGVDMVRVICLLVALTGNMDRPGGNVLFSIVPQNLLPTVKPKAERMGRERFPLFPQIPFPALKEALIGNDPKRPRAMIVHHANPVLVQANQERTKRALAGLDFLLVLDVFPTATAAVADLVLPAAADCEALDYRAYSSSRGGFVALREKVVEPAGEARSVFEIEYELARRMGMEKEYPFRDAEEWVRFALGPSGVTVEDLRRDGVVYASGPVAYRKYEASGFRTPSGKVECRSERFAAIGQSSLPAYRQAAESPSTNPGLSGRYGLLATTRRPAEFVHTKLVNLEVTARRYPDPLLFINPADAAQRGIGQGDMVEVSSARGSVRMKTRVTDDIGRGMVSLDFGWGNPTDGKANINVLTSDEVWDPVSGGYPNRLFMVDVAIPSGP